MSNILDIQSIRRGSLHIDPLTGEAKNFASINKAKAHSRVLGGSGKVRALKQDQIKDFRKEYLTQMYTNKLARANEDVQKALLAEAEASKKVSEAPVGEQQDKATKEYREAWEDLTTAQEARDAVTERLVAIKRGEF